MGNAIEESDAVGRERAGKESKKSWNAAAHNAAGPPPAPYYYNVWAHGAWDHGDATGPPIVYVGPEYHATTSSDAAAANARFDG